MICCCSRAHSTVMVSGANHLSTAAPIFPHKKAHRCSVRSLAPLGMTSDEAYVSPFF
jgi:hypothetical protein